MLFSYFQVCFWIYIEENTNALPYLDGLNGHVYRNGYSRIIQISLSEYIEDICWMLV